MDFPLWNHARNPDDRSSCKSLKLCALYLLFRLFVELESTQVKMALPTLPGDWEELLLVRRTEKKTSKKQLFLQRGAKSQCAQCLQAGRDTRGLLLFWVARVDEQGRRGPNHQQMEVNVENVELKISVLTGNGKPIFVGY